MEEIMLDCEQTSINTNSSCAKRSLEHGDESISYPKTKRSKICDDGDLDLKPEMVRALLQEKTLRKRNKDLWDLMGETKSEIEGLEKKIEGLEIKKRKLEDSIDENVEEMGKSVFCGKSLMGRNKHLWSQMTETKSGIEDLEEKLKGLECKKREIEDSIIKTVEEMIEKKKLKISRGKMLQLVSLMLENFHV